MSLRVRVRGEAKTTSGANRMTAPNKQELAILPSLLPLFQFIHEERPTQLHRFNRARARCLEGHLSEDLENEHPDIDARQ